MTAMIEWETLDENELREVINRANYWLDQLTRKQQIVDLLAELTRAGEPGIAVNPGDPYTHKGALYLAIQAHKTQSDWAPDRVPALWKKVG